MAEARGFDSSEQPMDWEQFSQQSVFGVLRSEVFPTFIPLSRTNWERSEMAFDLQHRTDATRTTPQGTSPARG